MKQRVFRMELCNNDGADEINSLLDDGWTVKEWHVASDNDGSYAVYLLEKIVAQ